jgi:hypothetical protein
MPMRFWIGTTFLLLAAIFCVSIVRYILIMTTRPIDQCPDHSYRKDEKQLKSHHQ